MSVIHRVGGCTAFIQIDRLPQAQGKGLFSNPRYTWRKNGMMKMKYSGDLCSYPQPFSRMAGFWTRDPMPEPLHNEIGITLTARPGKNWSCMPVKSANNDDHSLSLNTTKKCAFILPLKLKRSFEDNFQCSITELLFADVGICGDGNLLDERCISI